MIERLPRHDSLPPYMKMPSQTEGFSFCPPQENPIPQEFAFTSKQRAWWLNAYNHQCAFPMYNEERGYYRCLVRGDKNLQIHHIIPTSWQEYNDPQQDPNDTLGIALCKSHHDDVIHPDIGEALRNYYKDPESIKRALQGHKDKVRHGEVFWNTDYDEMFKEIAERTRREFLEIADYPKDVSWAKKYHPKKKGWWDFLE